VNNATTATHARRAGVKSSTSVAALPADDSGLPVTTGHDHAPQHPPSIAQRAGHAGRRAAEHVPGPSPGQRAHQHQHQRQHQRDIPSGAEIAAVRKSAGLTQAQAAELVHLSAAKRWSEYERGTQTIDAARWELFVCKVGRHPRYRPVINLSVTKTVTQTEEHL
jgi:DNA-binding transcriptional regulator YiaG